MPGYILLSACAHAAVIAALIALGASDINPFGIAAPQNVYDVTNVAEAKPASSMTKMEFDQTPGNARLGGGSDQFSGRGPRGNRRGVRPSGDRSPGPMKPADKLSLPPDEAFPEIPPSPLSVPSSVLVAYGGQLQIHTDVLLPSMAPTPDPAEEAQDLSPEWTVDVIRLSEVHDEKLPVFVAPVHKPAPRPKKKAAAARKSAPRPRPVVAPEAPIVKTPPPPAPGPVQNTAPGKVSIDAGDAEGSPLGIKGGFPYAWYIDIIRSKLSGHWGDAVPDRQAQACVIQFVIHRDGSVSDVAVETSSGNPIYDQNAANAVFDSSPFPRLPSGYAKDEIEPHVQFRFTGE